jgi:aldehyde dehydrogenase (NAD+)
MTATASQHGMKTYQNFVGGEWVSARSGKTYQNHNPADRREIVAEYGSGGREDAQDAIAAAAKAFAGGQLHRRGAGTGLEQGVSNPGKRKAELAELLTREEGKTLAESTGEVQRAIDIFRFFGESVTPSAARRFHTICRTTFCSPIDSRSEWWH